MRQCRDAFVPTISTFYIALFSEKCNKTHLNFHALYGQQISSHIYKLKVVGSPKEFYTTIIGGQRFMGNSNSKDASFPGFNEKVPCIIPNSKTFYIYLGATSNTTLQILSVKGCGGTPQIRHPCLAENFVRKGGGVPP